MQSSVKPDASEAISLQISSMFITFCIVRTCSSSLLFNYKCFYSGELHVSPQFVNLCRKLVSKYTEEKFEMEVVTISKIRILDMSNEVKREINQDYI